MDRRVPQKEEEAAAAIASVDSKPIQNLIRMAIGQARLELVRGLEQSEDDWARSLPVAPFDMEFLVRVLKKAFRDEQTVRQILDGASIAEATGWE